MCYYTEELKGAVVFEKKVCNVHLGPLRDEGVLQQGVTAPKDFVHLASCAFWLRRRLAIHLRPPQKRFGE